ncbi:ribosomal protein S18-alanine N-acetyltransferase [Vibrio porteresiae]|uniref:[Ribosomal protein bS18]-alanine N-acetyltransferase n=1 Tax=Vibrio porteresiae DSM 19223 TaxID=1123496 RepID=A0ABZ0QDM8_9VIBR|nr:ribosomal protein S18-alanine N-acetyltransferase [Vibrio porteresiae]WPC73621.1 ribosomal protein S18-alanine N-acetyltransferase [Vibrio porteresiae DSM 19223]
MSVTFAALSERHLDAVWAIEQIAHSHPWKQSMIYDLKSRGQLHSVMLVDEKVVGYFYAQNIVGEVSLLNIAIDPTQQGKGYGRALANYFIELCEKANAESAWLEVRESNHRAISLYDDLGFHEIDRRINYYPTAKGSEDALIMSYMFLPE